MLKNLIKNVDLHKFAEPKKEKLDEKMLRLDSYLKLIIFGYFERPRLDRKRCPLEWWSQQSMNTLVPLAMGFLSVATSQADVERIFSTLAFILNPLRVRLNTEPLQKSIILRINREYWR